MLIPSLIILFLFLLLIFSEISPKTYAAHKGNHDSEAEGKGC